MSGVALLNDQVQVADARKSEAYELKARYSPLARLDYRVAHRCERAVTMRQSRRSGTTAPVLSLIATAPTSQGERSRKMPGKRHTTPSRFPEEHKSTSGPPMAALGCTPSGGRETLQDGESIRSRFVSVPRP